MTRSLETQIDIDAPVATVWRVLVTTSAFAEWNGVVRLRGPLRAGALLPMSVRLFDTWLRVPIRVDVVDEGRELRWRGGPPGLFVGSHYFRLVDRGDRTTLYQGEVFRGAAVPLLLPRLRPALLALYHDINEGLRTQAETKANADSPAGRAPPLSRG